jgi:hypothetical protein
VSLLLGETGKAAIGTLKTFNITLATPREDNLATTPANFTSNLPTTQTLSVGATFTVQSGDLPVISPSIDTKYAAILIVAGKNTSGGSANVTTQGFKNTVSVATSTALSSIPNNNYWTHSVYRFPDVVVGDVLNVQVWANVANVTYDYCALVIYPTQMQFSKDGTILKDFSLTNWLNPPAFTKGVSQVANNTQNYVYYFAGGHSLGTLGTNVTFPVIPAISTASLGFRVQNGDVTSSTGTSSNATNHPHYWRNNVPCTISFREVLR